MLGVPNAAALGLITGVLNLIPVVGPWIGGAVAAVVGLFVSPITAMLALALTVWRAAIRVHVHRAEAHAEFG